MGGPTSESKRTRTVVAATAALVALGVAGFRMWRERAPLARSYRRATRRPDEARGDRGPDPEREPGTDAA